MDQPARDQKLTFIRSYLEKHLPHCMVRERFHTDGPVQLSVAHGTISRCAVQVCPAIARRPGIRVPRYPE